MSYTPAIFATSFCYVLDKLCPGNRMSISAKLAVERLRMTFYQFSWSMEFWAGTGKPCKSRVSCVVPIITHYHALYNASRGLQQGRVRDGEYQVPPAGGAGGDL